MSADSPDMPAESPADETALERDSLPPPGRRLQLRTLDHLDGRTLAARRVRDAEQALIQDLGGDDVVSTAQRGLIRRAAVLSAILEDREARWADGEGLEIDTYLAGANALRRLLVSIGLERRARALSPTDWVKQRGRQE